jgi:hypothetical protein
VNDVTPMIHSKYMSWTNNLDDLSPDAAPFQVTAIQPTLSHGAQP